GVARDSRQRGIGQRWSDDRVAGDDENIFAGAFADVAVGIERDAFDVAVGARFHADELGIHVIGGALGHLRQSVGRGTIPGADADVHAIAQAFFTKIFSPGIAGHVHLDGAAGGVHSSLAIAAENYGADVAGANFIHA